MKLKPFQKKMFRSEFGTDNIEEIKLIGDNRLLRVKGIGKMFIHRLRNQDLTQEPANRFKQIMKKLFLTSYSFKGADDNIHKDYRIVMVQQNEVPESKDFDDVVYSKMQRWFPENHGPECELLSIIAHPTITGYAEDNIIRNENHEAFKPVDRNEIIEQAKSIIHEWFYKSARTSDPMLLLDELKK